MPYQFWTTKQIQQLRDLAGTMTAREIGRQIHRTENAVFAKADELGIEVMRLHCNDRWTDEHLALFEYHTASQVAKLTGRTYHAAWQKLNQLRQKLAA